MTWTGPYTVVEVNAVGDYKLKGRHGNILKSNFPPRQVKQYFQGMPAAYRDEDPIANTYTSVDATYVDDDEGKCKEAHKEMTIMHV